MKSPNGNLGEQIGLEWQLLKQKMQATKGLEQIFIEAQMSVNYLKTCIYENAFVPNGVFIILMKKLFENFFFFLIFDRF